jgi:hypothetical protein
MKKREQYTGRPKGLSKKYKGLIYIGAKFGSWEVISEEVIKSNYGKNTIRCRCRCGNEKNVDVYTLGKYSQSCFNCGHNKIGSEHPNYKGYKEIPQKWFSRYTRRDRECNIKIEMIYGLWLEQGKKCALSGIPIDFKNTNPNPKNYRCNASLDRIDSTKGYIIGNIQLVHKDINSMKSDFEQNYFIKMCKLISINNE